MCGYRIFIVFEMGREMTSLFACDGGTADRVELAGKFYSESSIYRYITRRFL